MWQAFNLAVIENDWTDRFIDISSPDVVVEFQKEDLCFMYMYLNVLHVEYEAAKKRLISADYATETLVDSLAPSLDIVIM